MLACGCSTGAQATPAPTESSNLASAAASGPLPLVASQATKATYTFDGAAKDFLVFAPQKITVSASCAKPDGSVDCAALQLLRKGKTVHLAPAEYGSGIAPGAVICKKLGLQSSSGRSADGNESGFCNFGDGSVVTLGTLDANVLAP